MTSRSQSEHATTASPPVSFVYLIGIIEQLFPTFPFAQTFP